MDTSEDYVKMSDCPEIQDKDMGGLYMFNNGPVKGMFYSSDPELKSADCDIWLPRQDQIQEMMGIDSVPTFETAVYEMFFESDNHAHYNATPEWRVLEYDSSERFATPEQLWLAFYMHKKYQKTWDGEKWEDKPTPTTENIK